MGRAPIASKVTFANPSCNGWIIPLLEVSTLRFQLYGYAARFAREVFVRGGSQARGRGRFHPAGWPTASGHRGPKIFSKSSVARDEGRERAFR